MKILKKIFIMFFSLLLIFNLGFGGKLFAENVNENEKKLVYVENIFYDENGKLANGWYNDGEDLYYFQSGKKFTGLAIDKGGSKYFLNGKYGSGIYKDVLYENGAKSKGRVYVDGIFYGEDGKPADWWYKDGEAWYFFQNGKKFTGIAKDSSGYKYFVNGKYGSGIYEGILYKNGVKSEGRVYVDGIFYGEDLKPANWWYDDGTSWYFFQNGKKHNGYGVDGNGKRYFVNGKYVNGYVNKLFYENGKLANWWYDDGTAWYFFKEGKKHNGKAVDGNGEMQFVNGKYANTYIDEIFYREGKIANWWCDDGSAWYFFQNGKKYTGYGIDLSGKKYFVDGKYANGEYEGILYKEGLKSKGQTYIKGIYYDENKLPANGWYDDGSTWYFFKDGKKFTGHGIDGNGKRYFVEGKYANGIYEEKLYKEGLESNGKTYINGIYYNENKLPANGWYDDGYDWFFFRNGKKYTGKAVDGNGEMDFVNGKYKNYRRYYMASREVQMRILNAAYNTSSPGRNLCAKWVSRVYQNAGLGYLGGNANDMYRNYTFTSDIGKLKIGMIVAVESSSSSGSRMGRIYGHVGIYIGDGKVMESVGYKRVITLDNWISTYCQHHPVGFGYPPSVEK